MYLIYTCIYTLGIICIYIYMYSFWVTFFSLKKNNAHFRKHINMYVNVHVNFLRFSECFVHHPRCLLQWIPLKELTSAPGVGRTSVGSIPMSSWRNVVVVRCIWLPLQGTNISHLGKKKIIFNSSLEYDMLVAGK